MLGYATYHAVMFVKKHYFSEHFQCYVGSAVLFVTLKTTKNIQKRPIADPNTFWKNCPSITQSTALPTQLHFKKRIRYLDTQQSQCFNTLRACFFGSSTSDIGWVGFLDVVRGVAMRKILGLFHTNGSRESSRWAQWRTFLGNSVAMCGSNIKFPTLQAP